MESCSVLIVGGGPAGLTIARWIGKGAIVVHKDAEIGLPVRTSGGSCAWSPTSTKARA